MAIVYSRAESLGELERLYNQNKKNLKQKDKGNKPEALLNTIYFGLRGFKEHRDLCLGDVKLRQTTTGLE